MDKKDRLKELASNIEADYSVWKIIVVIAFTCIAAGSFGIFLGSGIAGGVAGAGLLFLSCLVMQALLIKGLGRFAVGALFESVAMVAPIFIINKEFPLIPLAFAALVSFLAFIWAQLSARDTLENELKVRFLKISKAVLPKSFTAVAIVIAVVYGFSFEKSTLFSPEFLDPIINTASPVVGYFVPGFSPDMSARDFLAVSAKQSLAKSNVIDFNVMPEKLRNQLIDKTVEGSQKALEDSFGVTVDLTKSFKENVRTISIDRLQVIVSQIPVYLISLAVALIVFLTAKAVGFVIYWIVAFFAFIMYQVLLSVGFAEVSLETRSREIVLMK